MTDYKRDYKLDYCGDFRWSIYWLLADEKLVHPKRGGFVLQHITWDVLVADCATKKDITLNQAPGWFTTHRSFTGEAHRFELWEAWQFKAPGTTPGRTTEISTERGWNQGFLAKDDTYDNPGVFGGNHTYGFISIQGIYSLGQGRIPSNKLPEGGADPPSGPINSSWVDPKLNTQKPDNHDLSVKWDCCDRLPPPGPPKPKSAPLPICGW